MNEKMVKFVDHIINKDLLALDKFRLNEHTKGRELLIDQYYSHYLDGISQLYVNSNKHHQDILEHPFTSKVVEKVVAVKSVVWDLVKRNPLCSIQIDDSCLDKHIYGYCLSKEPYLIALLNSAFQSNENILGVIKNNSDLFKYVREDLRTYKLCQIAFNGDKQNLKYIPQSLVTEQMVTEVMQSGEYSIEYVPKRYWTEDYIFDQFNLKAWQAISHVFTESVLVEDYELIMFIIQQFKEIRKPNQFMKIDPIITSSKQFYNFVKILIDNGQKDAITFFDPKLISHELLSLGIELDVYKPADIQNMPHDFWNTCFGSIYSTKSKLAYYMPYEYQHLLKTNSNIWIKHYVELEKNNEGPEKFPSKLISEELFTDIDVWTKLGLKRYLANAIAEGNINSETLKNVNLDNCSLAEISYFADSIPKVIFEEVCQENSLWLYAKFRESNQSIFGEITSDEILKFLHDHPYLINDIPKHKLDSFIMTQLELSNFESLSYLTQ